MKEDNEYIIEAYETGLHNNGLEGIVVDSRKTKGAFEYKGKTMKWFCEMNIFAIEYDGEEVVIEEFDFEQAINEQDREQEELTRQTEIAAIQALGY